MFTIVLNKPYIKNVLWDNEISIRQSCSNALSVSN